MAGEQDWKKGHIPMGKDFTDVPDLHDNRPQRHEDTIANDKTTARYPKSIDELGPHTNPKNR